MNAGFFVFDCKDRDEALKMERELHHDTKTKVYVQSVLGDLVRD